MTLRQLLSSDYVTGLVANNMDTIDQVGRNLVSSVSGSMTKTPSLTLNMYEKDNKFHYELEVPGIEKDNIKLQQTDGFIKVTAERKMHKEVTKDNYQMVESVYGKFERKFRLPVEADPKTVDAKFKNGMLLISVNKVVEDDEVMKDIEIN